MRQNSLRLMTCAAVLHLAMLPALAVQPDEILPDPVMEARARTLSAELRCLVCQNQSIDDSNAPLARDLRLLVRERLKANDSDQAVLDYIVARYGDFVLLKPPVRSSTLLLWVTPVLVLLGALVLAYKGAFARVRGTVKAADDVPLSDEEKARLAKVLKDAD